MYIGSHSLTHRDLTEISEEELEKELFLSKELLENRLGLREDLGKIYYGLTGLLKSMLGLQRYQELRKEVFRLLERIVTHRRTIKVCGELIT